MNGPRLLHLAIALTVLIAPELPAVHMAYAAPETAIDGPFVRVKLPAGSSSADLEHPSPALQAQLDRLAVEALSAAQRVGEMVVIVVDQENRPVSTPQQRIRST